MNRYPPDAPVEVRPYQSRREGDTAVIGDDLRGVYLSIPIEGLDILDSLARGRTVGETVRSYEDKHQESPDIEPFLDALAEEGFVNPSRADAVAPPKKERQKWWNLDWVSQKAAKRLVNTPVILLGFAIIATGIWLASTTPGLMPDATALQFKDHYWMYIVVLSIVSMATVFLHELAHVLAARSVGVKARIEIGNQLYLIVGQTDMSGVWLLPRRKRLLAVVAGVLFDLTAMSTLLIVLWLDHSGVAPLPEPVRVVLNALVFSYVIRFIVQCYMFVRTDLYYAVAIALNTRSLMADTEAYLLNLWRRVRRARVRIDQSAVRRKEMWAIRLYAVLWVVGRLAAIASLVFITIPLIIYYGGLLGTLLFTGTGANGFGLLDMLSISLLFTLYNGGGVVMWINSLVKTRRRRKAHPDRVLVT
ncbi:hypothetical protein GCM10009677_54770 [Sphaerisporangium rubeum]|uniref:Uncharacterized protein n=1 Tax=Sphaerisporangium rubeum TaxID=321317 RepID=A0A7X0IBX9_9ACTN|nr:hypothetical protein [Sphaerisporangium rubeum]MBB6470847.1 hypothetical protein [Sphaerisporangium rubeum]